MELVDVEPGDPRLLSDVFPVLRELRPHLTEESLTEIYRLGHPQGLRFTVAYVDGRGVGVAGWRIIDTTAMTRKLYVDDLVTAEAHRSRGVGRALLEELDRRARAAGCLVVDLDSNTDRTRAHAFYRREGFEMTSYHFLRRLP